MRKRILATILSAAAAMFALTGPASITTWLPTSESVQAQASGDAWDW